MTRHTTRSSRPDEWTLPRARSGLTREQIHGSIRPMGWEPRTGTPLWIKVILGFAGGYFLIGLLAAVLP